MYNLKFLILTAIFFGLFNSKPIIAQNSNPEWIKQAGGNRNESVYSITVDKWGNVYTLGGFQGTTDLDPGAGVYNLVSAGSFDIFIQKLDANGNFLWAKKMGGTQEDTGYSIATDINGYVYTTGEFYGTVDFNPGKESFMLTSMGDTDIFIQKLDSNGNFVWAKKMGGTGEDTNNSIAVDSDGNTYITGRFTGTVDFDPGENEHNLTTTVFQNAFIQKLDTNGNFAWAIKLNGNDWGNGRQVILDTSGNIYVTGEFFGTIDFNLGSEIYNLNSAGSNDAFILKLDANGNFVWAKKIGGTSNDVGISINVDNIGNVYVSGNFLNTVDFDPNESFFNLTSDGNSDVFILKLDLNGNFVWAKKIGGTGEERVRSTAVDSFGNIYTSGYFINTVDFNPGTEIYNLTPSDNRDLFIQKLDTDGNFVWAKKTGGLGDELGISITIDTLDNLYIVGTLSDMTEVNSNNETISFTSVGGLDFFVSKVNQSPYLNIMKNQTTNHFNFFPNPCNGILNIQFNSPINKCNIKLYTQDGRLVQEQDFSNTLIPFEITGPQGLYILKITKNDSEQSIIKVIKQ